jgi:hypothetical protein
VDPEQVTDVGVTAAPVTGAATLKEKVGAVRLEQFTGTLKVALMGAPTATSAAPRAGDVEDTKMGVVSGTVIVSRPQPEIETARSVSADKNHVL